MMGFTWYVLGALAAGSAYFLYEYSRRHQMNWLSWMTAQVEIWVSRADEAGKTLQDITIPAIAVVGDESGKSYVWVVDETDMTVHKKEVKAGEMVGSDDIHIGKGLEVGEKVVTAGMIKLYKGMKVRIWEEK